MTWLAVFMIGACGFVTGGAGVLGYMLPALRQVERENRDLAAANRRMGRELHHENICRRAGSEQ